MKLKELKKYLEDYTEFSKGDMTKEILLDIRDTNIDMVDFSPYDLNNSAFLGVTFNNCSFDNVYLDGSNFGGSIFKRCKFCGNSLKKADWGYIYMIQTHVKDMDAFRTEFFDINLEDCTFYNCAFNRCIICNKKDTRIKNTVFKSCVFESTNLKDCDYESTVFDSCIFKNAMIGDIQNYGATMINCNEI